MKKTILFFGMSVATFFSIQSCSTSIDEVISNKTTVAEDKNNIKSTVDNFYNKLNSIDDGELSKFILYSMFNNTAQEYDDSYLNNVVEKWETQFGKALIDNKLQFANKKGTYTYNTANGTWVKTDNANSVVLKFPSVENQSTVDSELTISSYEDIQTSYNSETIWLPKTLNLNLKRNGTTIFSLALSNVTFDTSTNFSMPISANIKIFASPLTQNILWQRTTSKEFKFTYNASLPQGPASEIVANVTLKHSDYANISSKEDFKTVSGYISEGNLKVTYAMNAEALTAISDPTDGQINSNTKAEVLYNGQKIGDMIYKTINGNGELMILYSDGTMENVDVYVGDFEQKIKNIFANYLD